MHNARTERQLIEVNLSLIGARRQHDVGKLDRCNGFHWRQALLRKQRQLLGYSAAAGSEQLYSSPKER